MSHPLQQSLIPPLSPDPVPVWPLAAGWWWSLILLLALLALMAVALVRLRRRRQRQQQVLAWLDQLDHSQADGPWLSAINYLLKRACKQQGYQAALLYHGEQWLDFLCARQPKARRELLRPLASNHYQPGMQLDLDQRQQLLQEVRRWLRHTHA